MKVLLLNGSPRKNGSTATGINILQEVFSQEGIETEIFNIPNDITGCKACGYCKKNNKCIIDDEVNIINEKMKEFDGLIVGSPVYYAGISGSLKSFLDRLYYSGSSINYRFKAAAAFTSSRRAGNSTSFDIINKYFLISNMNVIGSSYWNEIHGNKKEETLQDLEGIDVLKQLALNMTYYLRLRELAKKEALDEPKLLERNITNFIR